MRDEASPRLPRPATDLPIASMDLGLAGKKALVCAASKGLGKGCAMALAKEGVNLVITARGRDALEATASELRKHGVKVQAVGRRHC